MTTVLAPISLGELFDKISILEIKATRIREPEKLANVRRELAALREIAEPFEVALDAAAPGAMNFLRSMNLALWEAEDFLRLSEMRGDFGATFVALARIVYRRNDNRAAIKREINLALGSAIVEEKSYGEAAA